MADYKPKVSFNGPVSLERVVDVPWISHVTLLIGATGVGKSNFLERLHGDNSLGIAGNSLESVTQEITCYKVLNVSVGINRLPLYLLDSPGFQDNDVSEWAVVKKVQAWCRQQGRDTGLVPISLISSVIYFHRITDKRLSGRQRQTLDLIRALLRNPDERRRNLYLWIGVVTTMWDAVWGEDKSRTAEQRLQELRDEHLAVNFGETTGQPLQFHNTHESAKSILDQYFGMMVHNARDMVITPNLYFSPLLRNRGKRMRKAAFASNIYAGLEERIIELKQRLRSLDEHLKDEVTMSNPELLQIYSEDKQKAEALLATFEAEKYEFLGPPKVPVVRSSIRERLKNVLFRK